MRAAVLGGLLALATAAGGLAGWRSRNPPVVPGADHAVRAAESPTPGACEIATTGGTHPGMVWVEGGSFVLGNDASYPEEGPSRVVQVRGFWMDQTEVTNAQFAEFVAATGHVTWAERAGRSATFHAPAAQPSQRSAQHWWRETQGASWRHPEGPASGIQGRAGHPVVHIALADAQAYARWKGRALPTEAQFELAAQGTRHRSGAGQPAANTWQGTFPSRNVANDGHAATAPVGCFEANARGMHDLIGNVWEWTITPYYARHDATDPIRPDGFDPAQPDESHVAVLKGGSFLCASDYCVRYRPEARIGQSHTLPAAHIGFRTVLNPR